MDTNKMREMREAFERTNSRDHRRQPPKGNNYIDPMAQSDWESFQKGWQASRETLVLELPDAVTGARRYLHAEAAFAHKEGIDECRKAIETQGLKVNP